ncbi:MAG: CusA/CzcA family heavy metal efflux RND transporter [Steroidobacteraceae bacterium]
MIQRLIGRCLAAPVWVLAIVAALTLVAALGLRDLKLDALPDLSDDQVIVKVSFPGQPPQRVEDQVTYPLATALLGVPGASTVRAFSMYGEAFVYVVLADGAAAAPARARVAERLAQLAPQLPAGASTQLGPDASGVGWILQYALVANSGALPVERLRALQDFLLVPELQAIPGVAEVATFGPGARQLQVDVDPDRLAALGLALRQVGDAVRDANQAAGGGAFELGRQRLVVSADARLHGPEDLLSAPLAPDGRGGTLRLSQVARVGYGPAPQQGVSDLDGQGQVVSGIVVMRKGENALRVTRQVKARLEALKSSLPSGAELRITYDRARPIEASARTLAWRLLEEGVVVAVVCGLFLWRVRSALVIAITLPIGLLCALFLLRLQGVTANIMSLGGLAIAVGAMVDSAVVMVEALHRKLERPAPGVSHAALVRECAVETGPALFFSLLVITVSFLPVLALQGQEGRLFMPLALTKTWAMAVATALSVTLIPVLMGLLIRGPVPAERANALNRGLRNLYRPLLVAALRRPAAVLAGAALVAIGGAIPLLRMGSEFMPPLDEGDLLYMPSTLPSVSLDEAADILQRTDALIRAMPEVASVHGKAGRSDSATDPAPLSMLETVILLKPRSQWPQPLSTQQLIARLDATVRLAGLTNSWGHPIRTRIEMLSTGVRTPLALRISGPDPAALQALAEQAEGILRTVSGVRSVVAERPGSGRIVEIDIDRSRASALGVRMSDITQLLATATGAEPVDSLLIGRERYPIVVRYPAAARLSLESLAGLRIRTDGGQSVELSQVARLRVVDAPAELRSENARPALHVLLDVGDGDVGGVLARAEAALASAKLVAPGHTLTWVGQYLRLRAATTRLVIMTAATVLGALLILYAHFRCWRRVGIVAASLPVAVAGGAWLLAILHMRWSFATAVGFIALAGVAAEFCVVMLLYLDQSAQRCGGVSVTAIIRGALLRLRPKTMTVGVILGGLLPLLFADGPGVDLMRPIAAPLVGGMLTAPLFSLFVVPVIYRLVIRRSVPAAADSVTSVTL